MHFPSLVEHSDIFVGHLPIGREMAHFKTNLMQVPRDDHFDLMIYDVAKSLSSKKY